MAPCSTFVLPLLTLLSVAFALLSLFRRLLTLIEAPLIIYWRSQRIMQAIRNGDSPQPMTPAPTARKADTKGSIQSPRTVIYLDNQESNDNVQLYLEMSEK